MGQDLRKMMREGVEETPRLSQGHEEKFASKLESNFGSKPIKKERLPWLKIASVALVFITVSIFGYYSLTDNNQVIIADSTDDGNVTLVNKQMTLGDISPDLKKVEDFYTAGINVQLASLEITDDTKDLIDGYMEQLAELNSEYETLNKELNTMGPTESTITALIDNLQLRLQLLFKLKSKLKELKNQNNEKFNSIQT
jgi:hypothetical protein